MLQIRFVDADEEDSLLVIPLDSSGVCSLDEHHHGSMGMALVSLLLVPLLLANVYIRSVRKRSGP